MDYDRLKQYLLPFAIGAAFILWTAVFFSVGKRAGYEKGYNERIEPKRDTIVQVDTHFIDRPVEVWREVEKPVYIAIRDTQIIRTTDSVFVALKRESKRYSGDEYQAQVSGVEPQLDWVKVFPKTMTITERVVEKKRWGFGVSVGPGVYWNGTQVQPGLGAVVGFQYRF